MSQLQKRKRSSSQHENLTKRAKTRIHTLMNFQRNEINNLREQQRQLEEKIENAEKFTLLAAEALSQKLGDKLTIFYEDEIPQDARDRMDIFFLRAQLNHKKPSECTVSKGIYLKEPFYKVYRGRDKAKVYLRLNIRASDFHIFLANGKKSYGPCDGFDNYHFYPVFEINVMKYDPENQHELQNSVQTELWPLINDLKQ